MMTERRYDFNGMSVAVGSGFDGYLRAFPWETDYSPGCRPSWAWSFAARFLNGVPTYEHSDRIQRGA